MTGSHLDIEILQELRYVMEDGFSGLIQSYLQDAQVRLAQLQRVVSASEADQIRHIAHSLKGSSANLGANYLAELLRCMEEYGRSARLAEAMALLPTIQQEYAQVQSSMQALLK